MKELNLSFAAVLLAAFLSPVKCEYVQPMYLDYLFSNGREEEAKAWSKTQTIYMKSHVIYVYMLGIPKTNLTFENGIPRYSKDLFEGDLLLTKEQQEEVARQGVNFDLYPEYSWGDRVPYYISPDFKAASANEIRKAIVIMNSYFPGCLHWSPWRPEDVDYIYFYPGDGCYTTLGKTGGQQLINLQDPDCIYQPVILHEMDHSMGMGHEQNRPDRDNYIRVLKDNLKPEWRSQFQKETGDLVYIGGKYDLYSIMHYSMYHPEVTIRPGLPTFEIIHNPESYDENRIGNAQEFTRLDKLKVLHMYGCGNTGV